MEVIQYKPEDRSLLAWFCFKTWFPFKTLRSVLVLSVGLGILFICLAIFQISCYLKSYEFEVIYANNENCIQKSDGQRCQSIIEITQDLQPPIVLLYFIQNAYINHRKYINSVSPGQLAGKVEISQARLSIWKQPKNNALTSPQITLWIKIKAMVEILLIQILLPVHVASQVLYLKLSVFEFQRFLFAL